MKWANDHGCPWDEDTCLGACEGGYLEVLKWAEAMVVHGTRLNVLQQPQVGAFWRFRIGLKINHESGPFVQQSVSRPLFDATNAICHAPRPNQVRKVALEIRNTLE